MNPAMLSVDEVFEEALRRTPGADREAFLAQSCGSDADLRQRVERLLNASAEAGSFLESPAVPTGPTVDLKVTERPGSVIGPYKLIEKIGEGGMGYVWMAQQTEPVKRLVAVKLIKAGMDSRQVIARFEAERQALALMDHPNIARVLDADTTSSGRPYFVMDLVRGVPITRYCDEHHLTPRQRLELFLPVCQAVQHAHQKGIIHRDLKPTNVIVALYDGKPVPKVIDFGVAKATGQSLTDKTLVTGFGNIVGTLEYMSPEQAEINQLDIDTRSDIYSLGVLLYELLTGSPPFTKKELEKAGMLEMLRVIREKEPSKPSTKLSTAEGLPTLAANRGTEPAKLTKLMRGELDWIAMRALEKDRARRYETANAFAMDVQRYLADEPVEAGPPSASYRLRKFARRHRRALTVVIAFFLLLISAVAALSIALIEVNSQRQQKEAALEAEGKRRKQTRAALDAMSSTVIEDWLTMQAVLLPRHKKFLEEVLHAYEEFAADTGQQEESRAGVAGAHFRVAHIRRLLGDRQGAERVYRHATEFYAGIVADFPTIPQYRADLAGVHHNLAILYGFLDRTKEAQTEYDQSLSIGRGLVSEFPDVSRYKLSLAIGLHRQGVLFMSSGQPQEAEKAYRESISLLKPLVANHPTEQSYRAALGGTLGNLGILLDRPARSREADPGRSQEAAEAFSEAVEIFQQLVAESPTELHYLESLAMQQDQLAGTLRDTGKTAEAEKRFLEALKTHRQLVNDFPGKPAYREGLAITLNNYGILLKNSERVADAERFYGDSLAIHKQLAGDFPETPRYQNRVAAASVNLARLVLARNDAEGAHRLLKDAVVHIEAALKASPRHPDYRNNYRLIHWRLAETHLALKDHKSAAEAASKFLEANVEPPRDAYTAAGLFAGCVRLATEDKRLSENERQIMATSYGDKALSALHQAVEKRAKEVSRLGKDPSLDPLRSRQDFQKLQAELEAKNKP